MNIAKITLGTGLTLSAGLTAAFAFYAPKALEAHDVATRVACEVQATQAAQSGIAHTPSTVCKMAARL
jgi:hypothetical protein